MSGLHPLFLPVLLILISFIPIIVLDDVGIYLFPVIYDSAMHNVNYIILFLIFLIIFSAALGLTLILLFFLVLIIVALILILEEIFGNLFIAIVVVWISLVLVFYRIFKKSISQKSKGKEDDKEGNNEKEKSFLQKLKNLKNCHLCLFLIFLLITIITLIAIFFFIPFTYSYALGFPRLFIFKDKKTESILYTVVFAENNKYVYYYTFEYLIKSAIEDGEDLKDILCDQHLNPAEKIDKFIKAFFTLTWEHRWKFLRQNEKKKYYKRKVIKHMKKYPAEDFWKNVILTNEDYYYKSLIENFQNSICSKR